MLGSFRLSGLKRHAEACAQHTRETKATSVMTRLVYIFIVDLNKQMLVGALLAKDEPALRGYSHERHSSQSHTTDPLSRRH